MISKLVNNTLVTRFPFLMMPITIGILLVFGFLFNLGLSIFRTYIPLFTSSYISTVKVEEKIYDWFDDSQENYKFALIPRVVEINSIGSTNPVARIWNNDDNEWLFHYHGQISYSHVSLRLAIQDIENALRNGVMDKPIKVDGSKRMFKEAENQLR